MHSRKWEFQIPAWCSLDRELLWPWRGLPKSKIECRYEVLFVCIVLTKSVDEELLSFEMFLARKSYTEQQLPMFMVAPHLSVSTFSLPLRLYPQAIRGTEVVQAHSSLQIPHILQGVCWMLISSVSWFFFFFFFFFFERDAHLVPPQNSFTCFYQTNKCHVWQM